jgi:hypothetical protein
MKDITNCFKHPITYVIMNWRREDNVRAITSSLKQQTMKCNTFVWNNNPDIVYKDANADVVVNASVNFRCGAWLPLFAFSFSDYTIKIDDDLSLRDNNVVEESFNYMKEMEQQYGLGNVMAGLESEDWNPDGSTRPVVKDTSVDCIKGRLMFFHRSIISKLDLSPFNTDHDEFHHGEIPICATLKKKGIVIQNSTMLRLLYPDRPNFADSTSAHREISHNMNRSLLRRKYL